ncbi:T-cell activation Rho GTPase-activating protein [Dasypus novemcinctus]|uniref:T-cell activation Rho GTPase-activating protein n=1 Tax=Dasypus novemcinctus TaxID=9361 RepID=UPI0003292980|nr:T-cell activation Rho GTPase-activating protein [Dasypus novemcinctus]
MKVISSCNAASKTLNANDMETFIGCQSEGDIKEHSWLASCESEDSICQLIEIKKRKKVLPWPFLMRRVSPPSDFSGALEPELKASLFDQPLSVICGEDDALPRPIQDILTILCLKGPSTEGIFRKAANEKARKELQEELNAGGMVDLESRPVHLLAVVFKDFLRRIPLKLLSCELFEEWMGALEKAEEEVRIEALRQVAEKLPRPNLLLLKHMAAVLHLISRNCEVSKMDSSNLAICIGPNVLTLETHRHLSLEAQRELNNKVKTLVEFLIDNCFEIFGENLPEPSRIASDDSLEHTDSSDTSTLQNDSAYDSTDPDAEAGGACAPQGPRARAHPRLAGGEEQAAPSPRALSLPPVGDAGPRPQGARGQPDRRYSEPSMSSSQEGLESRMAKQKLAKSQDDFSSARHGPGAHGEEAGGPFPEDVFPAAEGKSLKAKSSGPPWGLLPEASSSSSLEGSADSSPTVSPSSSKRHFFTRHQSFTTKSEKSKPAREVRKHSVSFSFASHKRVLTKAPSFGSGRSKGVPRDQVNKSSKKENLLGGRVVQERWPQLQSHTATAHSCGAFALSVDDVFQLVDQRTPGSPPSYQEALRWCQASELTARGGQTVGSLRARLLSWDSAPALPAPAHQGGGARHARSEGQLGGHGPSPVAKSWTQARTAGAPVGAAGRVAVAGRSELHRLRTVSEATRRCRQPGSEAGQLRCAKESYI